jgi:hypothetical protein
MTKAIAYFKHGQALTKLECEAQWISISCREPLYNRKTLLEVCHAMADEIHEYRFSDDSKAMAWDIYHAIRSLKEVK